MADPFDFTELGFPGPPTTVASQPAGVVSGGPASGIPPEMQPSSPRDQKDFEERVGGWERFFSTLANDRNMTNALLNFGSTALQPRVGGQTQAGQIGRAVDSGRQTYEQGRRTDIQEGFQQQQLGLNERGIRTQERAQDRADRSQSALLPRQIEMLDYQISAAPRDVQEQKRMNDSVIALNAAHAKYYGAAGEAAIIRGAGAGSLGAAKTQETAQISSMLQNSGVEKIRADLLAAQVVQGVAMEPPSTVIPEIRSAYQELMLLADDEDEQRRLSGEMAQDILGYQEAYQLSTQGVQALANPAAFSGAQPGGGVIPPPGGENPARGGTGGVTGDSEARANRAWEMNRGPTLPPTEQQRLINTIRAKDPQGLQNWNPLGPVPLTTSQSNDVPRLG